MEKKTFFYNFLNTMGRVSYFMGKLLVRAFGFTVETLKVLLVIILPFLIVAVGFLIEVTIYAFLLKVAFGLNWPQAIATTVLILLFKGSILKQISEEHVVTRKKLDGMEEMISDIQEGLDKINIKTKDRRV